jgi:hypothetical protein
MYEFYNAFGNDDYNDLCDELHDLQKGEDELIKGFFSRFMYICHMFTLVDKPYQIELIEVFLHLNSLSIKQDQLYSFELTPCFNTYFEVRCDSHEEEY